MDVFDLREQVVREYRGYVEGFLRIADSRIRDFVTSVLDRGDLWPDPLVQLNPGYQLGKSVSDLVQEGLLHPLLAQIFPYRLYQHQEDAIRLALQKRHYVVTSGTGSGKSLTYWIPIFDYVLKHQPEEEGVCDLFVGFPGLFQHGGRKRKPLLDKEKRALGKKGRAEGRRGL
ncbi:MAG: DEAD/DEAH box helicase [Fimbriimonadales bacterium]|nr:DEAD/DEAH box helicase [Fimbriimonadales bacterium]